MRKTFPSQTLSVKLTLLEMELNKIKQKLCSLLMVQPILLQMPQTLLRSLRLASILQQLTSGLMLLVKDKTQPMDSGTLLVRAQDSSTNLTQNSKILHIMVQLNSKLVINFSQRTELYLVLNPQLTQLTALPLSMSSMIQYLMHLLPQSILRNLQTQLVLRIQYYQFKV